MPAVARKDDATSTGHGCTSTVNLVDGPFSPNVFCNNIVVARVGSKTLAHEKPGGGGCVSHPAQPIAAGSSSVFVNGIALGRVGDPVDAGSVTAGSPTVFAGG
jgi:uncharacterized Zn-binding protein involved in type VI secretion